MPDTAGPGRPGPACGPRHAAPDDAPHSARSAALPRVPRRARHRQRPWWSGLLARGSLLALVLTASVVVAALVTRPAGDGGTPAATPSSAAPAPGGPGPAEWLAAALPRSTALAASADVREDLTGQGVPADRLRPAEDADASGSLLAVAGPAPPGSRVVARFDRPGEGSELLVVDPRPGEPTAEQRERRRSLAAALLANPTTGADPAVAAVLQSGEVDLRLLSLLAALAAGEGVGIAALPPLPGEEGTATPARRALLDTLGGAPVPADPAATERLRGWLAAQLPPFTPDDVQVGDDGVLVSFHYVPAPDSLVADATR
ncbi:hypothetical protein SAMN05660359_03041 [Geodermatophilus obscurus]|uniref:Uncharacterized protein n=1 Tax=Geodermatophilus obscurus TaxID=1861 RepID=A0A1I5GQV5_9ACTN|nr:hypothetical protein [Geodermatophilus obscurus]SFO38299.1 hypothetical protein SAMN05660359_03041 [Geodermatophilus obscurus]